MSVDKSIKIKTLLRICFLKNGNLVSLLALIIITLSTVAEVLLVVESFSEVEVRQDGDEQEQHMKHG